MKYKRQTGSKGGDGMGGGSGDEGEGSLASPSPAADSSTHPGGEDSKSPGGNTGNSAFNLADSGLPEGEKAASGADPLSEPPKSADDSQMSGESYDTSTNNSTEEQSEIKEGDCVKSDPVNHTEAEEQITNNQEQVPGGSLTLLTADSTVDSENK